MILLLTVSMLMVACKSQETATEPEPSPAEEETAEVEPQPEPEPEPGPSEIDIRVVEERVSFETEAEEASHQERDYFVIMGSFIHKDNAEDFTDTLRDLGFDPVILMSETGFHRLSVNAYDNETPARTRIQQIRTNYPEYDDTWLLIRKPQDDDY